MTRDWDPDTPGKPVNAAEMEIYVLKSQARRRIATKAAVAGVLSAGVLLVGVPAIAALTAVDVTYTCGSAEYDFNVELMSPIPAATQGATATLTWKILQPTAAAASPLPAVSSLPATASNKIVLEGDVAVSGTPVVPQPTTKKASGSAVPAVDVAEDAAVPLPTMFVTVIPTATGPVEVKPDKFLLKVVPTAAASPTATWYTCTPKTAAEAAAAAITFTVAPSAAATSPTPTPSETPTPTPTATTPKPTHTVYETVTNKPSQQVTRKPGGGAATGGGGDVGPDGRMFVMAGTVLVLGAGVGGLMMRRRRPNRG
ncbi:hypothetical protein OG589_42105 [Sphaerisporangium sp. NBC_01403]|uniref:hypothetical protein n=1 Tax=Sphaerisporangium sp. NBC_01403 TaxID=2903599 RepID=UPI003250C73B